MLLNYEAPTHRIRVSGRCTADDAARLCEAIDCFGPESRTLIVDLTGVTDLDPSTGAALLEATARVQAAGCRVSVLHKLDSDVQRTLDDIASGNDVT